MTETEKAYKDEIRTETLAAARKQVETCVGGMIAIAEKLLKAVGSDVTVAYIATDPARSLFAARSAGNQVRTVSGGKLSAEQEARLAGDIMEFLDGHDNSSCDVIATNVKWDTAHVSDALRHLVKAGSVIRTGARKATRYSLAPRQGAVTSVEDRPPLTESMTTTTAHLGPARSQTVRLPTTLGLED